MFSKFFIDRPIFATVLALLIVVAGLVTLGILPIAQYPDITPPTVQVSAVYPGANAQTVAQTVGIQRSGRNALYVVQLILIGSVFAHCHFCSRYRYRHGHRTGTEPRQRSTVIAACSRSSAGGYGAEAVQQYRYVPDHEV